MNKLMLYHIDLDKSVGENFSEYEYSEDGIPLVRFSRKHNWQSNPVTVCQFALHHFNKYIREKRAESAEIFKKQVSWLLQNTENGPNNSMVWYYKLDIPFYKLNSPWISGMAQGEALSVFVRAFQLTDDEKYLDVAHNVFKIFKLRTQEGGVTGKYESGGLVIEEYPTEPCSCVLNGFILALFGIYDYAEISGDAEAQQFFEKCTESLIDNLHNYDTGYWSLYDLYKPYRLTSQSYHRLHSMLLDRLYEITKNSEFKETSDRWKAYTNSVKSKSKWFIHKIKYKLHQNG